MKPALRAIGLLLLCALPACRSAAPVREARIQARMGARAVKFHLYAEAYFRFRKAAELDPSEARYLNNLAVLAETQGRFDEAQALYKKALALNPKNKKIKFNDDKLQAYLKPPPPKPPAP
jgi:Flp pilus assembly protein TadD